MEQDVREDFQRVYGDLNTLRESRAAQGEINRQLKDDVAKLTDAVTKLTSVIDQGRGALMVVIAISGAAGGLISWALQAFFHKNGG